MRASKEHIIKHVMEAELVMLTLCHVIEQLCEVLWCAQLGADIVVYEHFKLATEWHISIICAHQR